VEFARNAEEIVLDTDKHKIEEIVPAEIARAAGITA